MQAQGLFNDVIYTQLIAIIDLAVKQAMLTNDNFEMEFVSHFLITFSLIFRSFCYVQYFLHQYQQVWTMKQLASTYPIHHKWRQYTNPHSQLQLPHVYRFTEYTVLFNCELCVFWRTLEKKSRNQSNYAIKCCSHSCQK